MAKKAKSRPTKSSVKATKPKLDEGQLSKGDMRSLNALRKKYGDELAEKWFVDYLSKRKIENKSVPQDKDAELIAETLMKLIDEKKLKFPRGGYLVTRGRGRVNVTRPQTD